MMNLLLSFCAPWHVRVHPWKPRIDLVPALRFGHDGNRRQRWTEIEAPTNAAPAHYRPRPFRRAVRAYPPDGGSGVRHRISFGAHLPPPVVPFAVCDARTVGGRR